MCGLPVLITGAFADQLVEHIVADLAHPLRGTDAGLIHRLADDLGHRSIVCALGVRIQPRTFPSHDRGHDAGTGRRITSRIPVSQADSEASVPLQIASQVRSRNKDQRFDKWWLSLLLERLLLLQQRA